VQEDIRMKCPNCGAKIPSGSLYCEKCGEDIHIVPDFEPEVELNIEQTISDIAQDIRGVREGKQSVKPPKTYAWVWKVMGIGAGVLILLTAVFGGIYIYLDNSLQFQLERALDYAQGKKYEKAVLAYNRALELSGASDRIEIEFALADIYFQENNKIEYEYLLREIANDPLASSEQMESAYGKLIAIYRVREDYKSINELLLASDNEDIMRTYQAYVAIPPEFSIQSGYYSEVLPLKITAYGNGKIFYTLDGTQPSTNSQQYTAPIILNDGDYEVRAFFLNENNIASEISEASYHVQIETLPPPQVSTVSGEYEFPIYIEVESDMEGGEIYYTDDGQDPTVSSMLYTAPIRMPLGKTTYKFIRIDGAKNSDIIEREYSLNLNTKYTTKQAEEDVVAYSIRCGKIYDESGHFNETSAGYLYQYQYVANILKVSDFYVIAEIYRDEEGNLSKTGNQFAVNAYGGKIYKLLVDERNNYTLVDIEE